MPLGIVSDDEFLSELNNSGVHKPASPTASTPTGDDIRSDEIFTPEVVELEGEVVELRRGRGPGDNEVPESLRKIIGEAGVFDRKEALGIAKEFGISDSSVSAYSHGSTSTATYNKPSEQKSFIERVKKTASKRAGRKLLATLDQLTDEKLSEAPAGVIASVAKQLSGVIKDLEPEIAQGTNQGVQFIVFAPPVVSEEKFSVLELKE